MGTGPRAETGYDLALTEILEPGGAIALAAVYHKKLRAEGRTVGLTLSGGNVDPGLYGQILARFG
jgi:threonine dehydratase